VGKITSLRSFLQKEMVVKDRISTDYEIAREIYNNQNKTLVFENVADYDLRVVGNLCYSREALYRALSTSKEGYNEKVARTVENPLTPRTVKNGRWYETEAKSLQELPILRHFKGDGSKYMTSGIVVSKDPEHGRNASVHRLMVLGDNRLAIRLVERHLYEYHRRAEERGESLEVAIAIGVHPAILYAAGYSPSLGYDELGLANALLDGKLELARCRTVDVEVPAESEIVIEGRILPGERADEGPFVDITGTYDIIRKQAVIEVTGIAHRRNAYYHALLPGGMEHKIFMGMPIENKIYREVNKIVEVKNVCLTEGGCNWLHGSVSISKKHENDGRRAIHVALDAHPSMKHVIVVDEDINVFDPIRVEFALATRFQALRDAIVFPGVKGSSLDPSADKNAITTKLGLDATKPLNRLKNFESAEI
jgi:UbiD family decarboxylase